MAADYCTAEEAMEHITYITDCTWLPHYPKVMMAGIIAFTMIVIVMCWRAR